MSLLAELQQLLIDYCDNRRQLVHVRTWLEDHVDAVLASPDQALAELDGLAWILLSEHDRDDRDEASIREQLREHLPAFALGRLFSTSATEAAGKDAPLTIKVTYTHVPTYLLPVRFQGVLG